MGSNKWSRIVCNWLKRIRWDRNRAPTRPALARIRLVEPLQAHMLLAADFGDLVGSKKSAAV